jgi:PAS domain S-box-containing protein
MPMQRRATLNHPLALDPVVRVCALAVLLVGLVVLAGWALKIEALKSVLPGLTSMKPNTALCFVLAGIALAQRQRRGLRLGCAAAMIVSGGLSLVQDVTGADFAIDQLLFRDIPGAAQTAQPGRMSPITAVAIILLGGALTLLGTRRAALRWTLEAMALLALSLALIALIGYAFDTTAVFPLPGFSSMALLTPTALALLALGILCARADGLAGVFASAGPGGQVARRFLPLAIIAPVLLGWLVQIGESAGLFNAAQDTAVFAAVMVLALAAFSWRNALALATSDAERRHAEEAHARLAMIVETSDDAIIAMSIHGAILTWNAGAERMFGYRAEEAVGRPMTLLIPPQLLHEEEQIVQRLRRGEAIEHYETVRLAKDGRHLDVSLTTSPLKDAGGSVVGA